MHFAKTQHFQVHTRASRYATVNLAAEDDTNHNSRINQKAPPLVIGSATQHLDSGKPPNPLTLNNCTGIAYFIIIQHRTPLVLDWPLAITGSLSKLKLIPRPFVSFPMISVRVTIPSKLLSIVG